MSSASPAPPIIKLIGTKEIYIRLLLEKIHPMEIISAQYALNTDYHPNKARTIYTPQAEGPPNPISSTFDSSSKSGTASCFFLFFFFFLFG